ncbi:hypothetical protein UCMB321_4732 [Pseudomonas batumici]|uniref:Uncharacterized protein n=1 Tax=Pseudomonas batumici TaxID=226910 RepID=A0A0C2I3D2_9PSED|nr:hypothetical protein UCMB321_4732 [Pseudomonas batumici]
MDGKFGKGESADDAEHQSKDNLKEYRTRAPSEHDEDPGRCSVIRAGAADLELNCCGLTGMSSASSVYARFFRDHKGFFVKLVGPV